MSNQTIELAKKISAQLMQEEIKRGVADIRAKNPGMSFVEAYNQLARDRPDVLEEYAPAKDADRDQRISDACQELIAKNPGMMFETAHSLLKMTRSDLFPDASDAAMEKEEKVRENQATIHEEIKRMREKESHLTYALAFNRLAKEKPELFEEFDLEKGGEK
jgi:hypothetical protein